MTNDQFIRMARARIEYLVGRARQCNSDALLHKEAGDHPAYQYYRGARDAMMECARDWQELLNG